MRTQSSFLPRYAALGAALWLLALLAARPDPWGEAWGRFLLLWACGALMPLALFVVQRETGLLRSALPLLRAGLPASAGLLALACTLPPGAWAGLLAFPWLLLSLLTAAAAWEQMPPRRLAGWTLAAAWAFWAVGAAWAFAERLGFAPFGFSETFVLLTALHFHYAGFLLAAWLGLALRRWQAPLARTAARLSLIAIPMTAAGILLSHLRITAWLEHGAALLMAAAGLLTAAAWLRMSRQAAIFPWAARLAWALAGLALTGTMSLAALYALRFWPAIPPLSIPWMRLWHGSFNALLVMSAAWLAFWALPKQSAPLSAPAPGGSS
jgi:hypothetical protein